MASEEFTGSCAPVQLPCEVGKTYTFPCSCQSYMECDVTQTNLITRNCPNGLLWDHIEGACLRTQEVLSEGRCGTDRQWERCGDIANHYSNEYLARLCEGTQGSGGSDDVTNTADGDGGDSTGAIVGGIIAGLAVVLVVVAVVIYARKRKSQDINLRSNPTLRNDRPDQSREKDYNVYDLIDESAMRTSTKGEPKVTSESKVSNVSQGKVEHLQGRALQQPPGGAASLTLPQSDSDAQQNLHQPVDQSRSISIGGRMVPVQDSDGYEISYPSGSIPRQHIHAVKQEHSGDSDSHNYFVLEKS